MVVAVGFTFSEPESAFVPLQPLDAVHDVTLVEIHESVEVAALVIVEGVAVRVSVGVGVGVGLHAPGRMSGTESRSPILS